MNENYEAFMQRIHELWLRMNDAMSQGHNHTIKINPIMVDDLRAVEVILRDWGSVHCTIK